MTTKLALTRPTIHTVKEYYCYDLVRIMGAWDDIVLKREKTLMAVGQQYDIVLMEKKPGKMLHGIYLRNMFLPWDFVVECNHKTPIRFSPHATGSGDIYSHMMNILMQKKPSKDISAVYLDHVFHGWNMLRR